MTEETTKAETKDQRTEWNEQLDDTAEEAIAACPGDLHAAAKEMERRVRRDPRLQEAMLEVLVAQACYNRVRKVLQERNSGIWHGHESVDKTMRGDRLRRATRVFAKFRLMEYNLRGGLPLGKATRLDLETNAYFQDRQAKRMFETGMWLKFVADELPNDDPRAIVEDYVSEQRLHDLQTQAIAYVRQMTTVKEEPGEPPASSPVPEPAPDSPAPRSGATSVTPFVHRKDETVQ